MLGTGKYIIFILMLGPVALAEGISVSQTIDKSEVAFEDVVHLDITLTWPGSQTAYLFERPVDPILERLKVGSRSSTVSTSGTGPDLITTKKLSFTLVPVQAGTAHIRPVVVEYLIWPDSIPGELTTEAMAITIAEPVRQPEGDETISTGLVMVLVAGFLFIVIVIVVAAIRKRSPAEPVLTPAQVFLDGLAGVKNESDLKKFQTGLHKLLIEFVGAEYDIDVTGKSPGEIAAALEGSSASPAVREKITAWITRAEREKYTPATAAPGETIRLEAEIRQFFEKSVLK
ncbi:MAG: hypothetical protein JSU65_13255 [Candidatus Zixiibacteriota bacterium]|nr:MAG: hypothetical protein JSU65_13255 [candidate division Zixibacteria bacterium]